MARVIVLAGSSLGQDILEGCAWDWSSAFADVLGEPVLLATIDEDRLPLSEFVFPPDLVSHGEIARPKAASTPMTSADFVYRDDGAPDWAAMWSGFCELALFGGPPHRGEDSALPADTAPCGLERHPGLKAGAAPAFDAIGEIRRGIHETTSLVSTDARDGWLPVRCGSRKMAAWLCASIILENVDARCEGDTLFVPARDDYALKNEVKSVITVVAKTHHYWLEHVAARQLAGEGCSRPASPFRIPAGAPHIPHAV
jgi:sirohydrochlorin cobaltochelatase